MSQKQEQKKSTQGIPTSNKKIRTICTRHTPNICGLCVFSGGPTLIRRERTLVRAVQHNIKRMRNTSLVQRNFPAELYDPHRNIVVTHTVVDADYTPTMGVTYDPRAKAVFTSTLRQRWPRRRLVACYARFPFGDQHSNAHIMLMLSSFNVGSRQTQNQPKTSTDTNAQALQSPPRKRGRWPRPTAAVRLAVVAPLGTRFTNARVVHTSPASQPASQPADPTQNRPSRGKHSNVWKTLRSV